jgi:chemotaxis signal transduction protein
MGVLGGLGVLAVTSASKHLERKGSMENTFNGVAFRLRGSSYAIEALTIREIVGGAKWEPLSVEGELESFIQIRGKVARVVDLGERLGFQAALKEGLNSFIAVQAPGGDRNRLAALWVDVLLDLVQVPMEKLKACPPGFRSIPAKYLQAFIEGEAQPICVLNLDEILRDVFLGEKEPALENKAS